MKVTVVVGARPNFMKAVPVLHALDAIDGVQTTLLHTGQHYDQKMSDQFLQDLEVREPDVGLGVGSASHAKQTAEVLVRFEQFLVEQPQDLVVVVGDVNSTVAAAMASVKMHVPVAHVESGLRSRDRRMPEEINRLQTDCISALLFVTEPSGVANLLAEGIEDRRIRHVGNTMIDSLLKFREKALALPLPQGIADSYGLVTLHRPSNVDDCETLEGILDALFDISKDLPLWWPIHPRTKQRLEDFGLMQSLQASDRIHQLPPCGYLEFLGLMARSRLILTDSGGIQEEALVCKVPVVTLRENTERPVTVECGGNILSGPSPQAVKQAAQTMLAKNPADFQTPKFWDGQSGPRVAQAIVEYLERKDWL